MSVSCCRFSSKVVVPIPLPARKLCRTSWNEMEDNNLRLIILLVDFYITSKRPNLPYFGATHKIHVRSINTIYIIINQ